MPDDVIVIVEPPLPEVMVVIEPPLPEVMVTMAEVALAGPAGRDAVVTQAQLDDVANSVVSGLEPEVDLNLLFENALT
jgi:hypothetical protein